MLSDDTLTLEKAITIARSTEATEGHIRQLHPNTERTHESAATGMHQASLTHPERGQERKNRTRSTCTAASATPTPTRPRKNSTRTQTAAQQQGQRPGNNHATDAGQIDTRQLIAGVQCRVFQLQKKRTSIVGMSQSTQDEAMASEGGRLRG